MRRAKGVSLAEWPVCQLPGPCAVSLDRKARQVLISQKAEVIDNPKGPEDSR